MTNGIEQVLGPQHRRRDPQRHRFGPLQRERLRHHLADDDVEVGQDGDGDDAGEGMGREEGRTARRTEVVVDAVGEHVLAVHAEPEAGDGDPELRGRDVAVLLLRVAQHGLHRARQRVAVGGTRSIDAFGAPTMANSAATNTRVEQDQPGDDQEGDHRRRSRRRSAGAARP